MIERLKQFWCGLTTDHDFRFTTIIEGGKVHCELKCSDCGKTERSHKVCVATQHIHEDIAASTRRLDQAIIDSVPGPGPLEPKTFPKNAGDVRRIVVCEPKLSFLPKPEIPNDVSVGFYPYDHKAAAAKRKRNPNTGHFLPVLTAARLYAINMKLAQGYKPEEAIVMVGGKPFYMLGQMLLPASKKPRSNKPRKRLSRKRRERKRKEKFA